MNKSEAGKIGAKTTNEIHHKRRLKRIEEYNKKPSICGNCKDPLPYDKRHQRACSRSCAATINNQGVRRHGKAPSNCRNCDAKLKTAKMKYCSSRCQQDYQWVLLKDKIRKGLYTSTWSGSKVLRRFLIEERGERCEECKMNKWQEQGIPLSVHHIDGDASNNLPDNLMLLCLNCHGLTENFGKKNRESARGYRYKK